MKSYTQNVLAIDDNPDDQILIQYAFSKLPHKHTVHMVDGGFAAIEYLNGEGKYADREQFAYPSLILIDLKMPQGNGFDVLSHLNARPEWKIIPTVVLSSSADPDDVELSYLLGASAYHVKPSAISHLAEMLTQLLSYWATAKTPDIDSTGRHVRTASVGKLGEQFRRPDQTQLPD